MGRSENTLTRKTPCQLREKAALSSQASGCRAWHRDRAARSLPRGSSRGPTGSSARCFSRVMARERTSTHNTSDSKRVGFSACQPILRRQLGVLPSTRS